MGGDGADTIAMTSGIVRGDLNGGDDDFTWTVGGAKIHSATGDVTNNETITTADGLVGDQNVVNGNYGGNGVILMDVDTSNAYSGTVTVVGKPPARQRLRGARLRAGVPVNGNECEYSLGMYAAQQQNKPSAQIVTPQPVRCASDCRYRKVEVSQIGEEL